MYSIKGSKIYIRDEIIENKYVIVESKKIVDICDKPRGDNGGEFPVITPAFIDPHSHIGMYRAGEPSSESDGNEKINSFMPLAEAIDSLLMDDLAFQDSIAAGVLYSCILPGSGNIIGGRGAVIKNYAKNSSDAYIKSAGIKMAVGFNPKSVENWKGDRPSTRMGIMSLLREKFYAVDAKIKNNENLTKSAQIIRDILLGREIARVHAHKSDDIEAILRFTDEFRAYNYNIKISIEHASDVSDIETFEKLKKRGIKVIYGPLDSFSTKTELRNLNHKNIKHLIDSKVEYGLMSDHPVIVQRQLFCQLRWFLRHSLSKIEAIKLLTHTNAHILGIDNIVGSLEKDKLASFICWSGCPFELSSYPIKVYGEGELLYSEF